MAETGTFIRDNHSLLLFIPTCSPPLRSFSQFIISLSPPSLCLKGFIMGMVEDRGGLVALKWLGSKHTQLCFSLESDAILCHVLWIRRSRPYNGALTCLLSTTQPLQLKRPCSVQQKSKGPCKAMGNCHITKCHLDTNYGTPVVRRNHELNNKMSIRCWPFWVEWQQPIKWVGMQNKLRV